MSSNRYRGELVRLWYKAPGPSGGEDYWLLERFGVGFSARDPAGRMALVIPMSWPSTPVVGRSGAGYDLVGHASLRFEWGDGSWDEPAAVLTCTDPQLSNAFTVFAADILDRLNNTTADWMGIVTAVEEWSLLLAPRGRPSPDREAGLWAELWFIAHAVDVGRVLAAWRGPEADAMDFFLDGRGVDIKASGTRYLHYVSESQVGRPTGDQPAHLLAFWLKPDPLANHSVPSLVDDILARTDHTAEALKKISQAGYSIADRSVFTQRYSILAEPEWYPAEKVPRVRLADRGVSHLRYRVDLTDVPPANEAEARALWLHFAARPYRSTAL